MAAGRTFWSFQPLKRHVPPDLRDAVWSRRRIDRFLFAGMRKHGLAPAPAADRRTLLRRLTFDLVGLPPAPEEVDAFAADARSDAYERVVERLLASPRHGERWGRFWLDLVRYCDIPEDWSEAKGAAWLYRDWVVRSLNDDLPYDRFVQMQLAADLLPGAAPADRAALGFLGLSPNYWKELKLDHNVIKGVVAEEWEERIHTLSSTFLGLTVACARCHDHKFDPISTQDYYALAGVFASIRQTDLSLLPIDRERGLRQARDRLREIEKQLGQLRKKPKNEVEQQIARLTAEAQTLRRTTPHLTDPLAPGVIDSSLHVEADGPYRTRLVYKPAPQDVHVQVRGNPASSGPVAARRFLTVLSGNAPRTFRQGSGRLELAQALTNEGGAGGAGDRQSRLAAPLRTGAGADAPRARAAGVVGMGPPSAAPAPAAPAAAACRGARRAGRPALAAAAAPAAACGGVARAHAVAGPAAAAGRGPCSASTRWIVGAFCGGGGGGLP